VTVDGESKVWIATKKALYLFDGATWAETTAIAPWIGKTRVSSVAVSKRGIFWFGLSFVAPDDIDKCGLQKSTEDWGAYRFDGKTWTHFTTEDGLVDNKICDVVVGPDEAVWFGSFDKGISRFDGNEWISFVVP